MKSAGTLILFATLALSGCGGSEPPPPSNVVLVLIDTLRPDHLGFYGYERETAPYLSELAETSAVFERAFSTSSWTAPSTASLFTGLLPTRHGVTEGYMIHKKRIDSAKKDGKRTAPLNRLPHSVDTVPQIYRDAGYRTFGIATNLNIGPAIGFDRGFDEFAFEMTADSSDVSKQIESWKETILGGNTPYFLYLHVNDVHAPYFPHKRWYKAHKNKRKDTIARYDSNISFVDHHLRKISDYLGWDENTIIVIVSDHGEEFWEHGNLGHRSGLYQELNRVLMMVHAPGISPQRVTVNASLVDVLPTLLELSGVEPPESRDGTSLAGILRGRSPKEEEALRTRLLFAHRAKHGEDHGQHIWATIHQSWKVIEDATKAELFNHEDDFFEQKNRLESDPSIAADLRKSLAEFRDRGIRQPGDKIEVELDEKMQKHLEELGYVDDGSNN